MIAKTKWSKGKTSRLLYTNIWIIKTLDMRRFKMGNNKSWTHFSNFAMMSSDRLWHWYRIPLKCSSTHTKRRSFRDSREEYLGFVQITISYDLSSPQCQTEPPSIAVFLEMVYSGRYEILLISLLNDWSLFRYNWGTLSRNVMLAQLLQSLRLLAFTTTTLFYQTGLALRQISHTLKVTFKTCWTQWFEGEDIIDV